MRGLVIYPYMILHFDVGRDRSLYALKAAVADSRRIFLGTQKDPSVVEPTASDLYQVGVVAEVRQILKTPDNTTRVLVEGLYKVKLVSMEQTEPYLEYSVTEINTRNVELSEVTKQHYPVCCLKVQGLCCNCS